MGASIGIDLGTTNSVGAFTKDGTNPRVLPTSEREVVIPSVVARHRDGSLLTGYVAIRNAKGDPPNAIFSIKRLMGRRYADEEVEKVKKHVSYRIAQNSQTDMAYVMIGEKGYSPIEVSALILERVKADAQMALGEEVTHAVITVPAYFDDNQKWATWQAGGLAGLRVKRIIEEPTAAAYAFGMDLDPTAGKTILVYDLGGGTFDISIIFISSGIPTVENTGGDIWLGGDKFDSAIMDFVIDQVQKEYPGTSEELRKSPAFMWDLKQEAEKAKKNLGQAASADITMWGALKGKIDVNVTVRRADFEQWIHADIERSIALVEETMAKPGFSPGDIDHVLLVGGSTAIPLVRRLLAQKFGEEKIKATVDPMQCVALGAAILASRNEKKFCIHQHENEPDAKQCAYEACGADLADVEAMVKCHHCNGLHKKHEVICEQTGKPIVGSEGGIITKPFGIGVEGDRFEEVVPKGTHYPTPEPISREFKTVADNQECIMILPVWQGSDEIASRNQLVGIILVPGDGPIPIEKRVPKGTPFDVGFGVNEDGILTIHIRGKGQLSWMRSVKLLRPWRFNDERKSIEPEFIINEQPPMAVTNFQEAIVTAVKREYELRLSVYKKNINHE